MVSILFCQSLRSVLKVFSPAQTKKYFTNLHVWSCRASNSISIVILMFCKVLPLVHPLRVRNPSQPVWKRWLSPQASVPWTWVMLDQYLWVPPQLKYQSRKSRSNLIYYSTRNCPQLAKITSPESRSIFIVFTRQKEECCTENIACRFFSCTHTEAVRTEKRPTLPQSTPCLSGRCSSRSRQKSFLARHRHIQLTVQKPAGEEYVQIIFVMDVLCFGYDLGICFF